MIRTAATVVVLFVAITLLARARDRIRHPFWSRQPVMRPWNLPLWLGRDRVIDSSFPPPGRHPVDPDAHADVAAMVSEHYSSHGDTQYTPTEESIITQLGDGGVAVIARKADRTPIGCATATKASLLLHGRTVAASYVDHLCVEAGSRSKGVAADLISSVYAGARRAGAPPVFIFKHEGARLGMGVPLCQCEAVLFKTKDLKAAAANPTLRKGTPVEILPVLERRGLKCLVMPSPATVVALLEGGQWQAWTLDGHWFVMRDAEVSGEKTLDVIAAVRAESSTADSFVRAFAAVLSNASAEGWERVCMEALGDQVDLVKWARARAECVARWSCAYHLYNYAAWPVKPKDCCFLV
jgi:GNAT superfamily N-acetyltransferase